MLLTLIHLVVAAFLIYGIKRQEELFQENTDTEDGGVRLASFVQFREFTAIYFVSVGVLIMAIGNVYIGRLEPYFGIFAVLCIPSALENLDRTKRNYLVAGIVIFSLFYYYFHVNYYNNIVPYVTRIMNG